MEQNGATTLTAVSLATTAFFALFWKIEPYICQLKRFKQC
jgi:hypothetical protein